MRICHRMSLSVPLFLGIVLSVTTDKGMGLE